MSSKLHWATLSIGKQHGWTDRWLWVSTLFTASPMSTMEHFPVQKVSVTSSAEEETFLEQADGAINATLTSISNHPSHYSTLSFPTLFPSLSFILDNLKQGSWVYDKSYCLNLFTDLPALNEGRYLVKQLEWALCYQCHPLPLLSCSPSYSSHSHPISPRPVQHPPPCYSGQGQLVVIWHLKHIKESLCTVALKISPKN